MTAPGAEGNHGRRGARGLGHSVLVVSASPGSVTEMDMDNPVFQGCAGHWTTAGKVGWTDIRQTVTQINGNPTEW